MKKLKLILTSLAIVIAVTAAIALRDNKEPGNCTAPRPPTTTNANSPTPAASTPAASTSAPSTQTPAQP